MLPVAIVTNCRTATDIVQKLSVIHMHTYVYITYRNIPVLPFTLFFLSYRRKVYFTLIIRYIESVKCRLSILYLSNFHHTNVKFMIPSLKVNME